MSKLVENKSAPCCECEVLVVSWSAGGFSLHTSSKHANTYISFHRNAERYGENERGDNSLPNSMLTTEAFFAELKASGGTSFHSSLDGLDLEAVS
jgi:hypothetical protein